MRLIKILLCLCFLGCCSISNPPIVNKAPQLTTAQLVDLTTNSTVVLYNDGSICGAVWITKTTAITAYHCVDYPWKKLIAAANDIDDPDDLGYVPNVQIGFPIKYFSKSEQTEPGQAPTTLHVSKVLSISRQHDLALIEDKNPLPHSIVFIATRAPNIGDTVVVIGHPSDLEFSYTTATISAYRQDMSKAGLEDMGGPFMQVQGSMWPGNSGGGCFTTDGKLAGIASFMNPKNPTIGFFIPVGPIYDLLAKTKF
jgi:hypothetical protein